MIDKRKKYTMVFDTETTGEIVTSKNGHEIMQKYIYDIGYTIADKKKIHLKRNFIVKEIFEDVNLMNSAYYKSKIPMYNEMIKNGEVDIIPFAEIVKIMQKDIQMYNVTAVAAYNISFDLDAFMQTTNTIYPNQFQMLFRTTKKGSYAPDTEQFFQKYIARKKLEIIDIWTLACQTLCNQKTFQTYYKQETAKGNIKSNAEIVYSYIIDNEFIEDHTALSDSIIETEILQRIQRIHQKIETKFAFMPYRLIEKKV